MRCGYTSSTALVACSKVVEREQVTYNPREVSYERLLSEFFQRVDPTTRNRQARGLLPEHEVLRKYI